MAQPHEREIEVFNVALELPIGQRAAYLDLACADDPGLRRRVESLLAADDQAAEWLPEASVFAEAALKLNRPAMPDDEAVGKIIGRYKLLEKVGEGGFGVVYVAQQKEPVCRRVALKVIKLGMDTKEVIARFEAERQALALMDHPNIAKVLDAGTTETSRPYFVMELVRGIKITEYCDQNQLPTKERLGLFVKICHAIQHAHQKGIIHRDIKPSNILVTLHDGVPVPKVIDFGIAKATEGRLTAETIYTQLNQFIGTPAYMSPEQAEMSGLNIDTRSDIYSLGVLLYELLTGRTPFDAKELMSCGLDAMRRIIREQEPVRPSTRLATLQGEALTATAKRRSADTSKLLHQLRGDLDWIVMKCLEKDRTRRYETANGLAMDIQRHLTDEPVVARPPNNYYRLQKLVQRNKVVFSAGVFVLAALIAGLGVATVAMIRIERADQQIRQAKNDATEELRVSHLAEARALRTSSQARRRFDSLDAVRKAAAIRPDITARNEAIASLAVSDLRVAKEVVLSGHAANDLVGFDFNLGKYVVGDTNGNITIRAVTNDTLLAVLPAPGLKVRWIRCFSPDSRFLRVLYQGEGEQCDDWVWDLNELKVVIKESSSDNPVDTAEDWVGNLAGNFSSDSRFFSRCHLDGTLSIYELGSGKEVHRFPGTRRFNNLVLSPGNDRMACVSGTNPVVEVRAVASGQIVTTVTCPVNVGCVAWSSDGKRLATAGRDFHIYLWEVATGQQQADLEGPTAPITSVAFDHAGNALTAASWDGLIRLWNADGGREIARYPGGSWQLQFSADDRQLLGWQYVDHFGALEVADSREFRRLAYVPSPELNRPGFPLPDFSADGQILACSSGGVVRFWNALSGQAIASQPMNCDTHIFEPGGRGLIIVDWSEGVRRRALLRTGDSAAPAFRLDKSQPLHGGTNLYHGALSHNGRYLAYEGGTVGKASVLDLENLSARPVALRPDPVHADRMAISPDGRWVATSSWHTLNVQIYDGRTGALVHALPMPGRTLTAFSPDGRWLATSTSEYQLWEVGSWHPKGPPRPGCKVPEWNFTAFSPDGQMMARTLDGTKIQLLETSTEAPLATLEAPDAMALGPFQFSPDGTHLAAVQQDKQTQLWDLRLIRQELKEMHLDWDTPPFSPAEQSATASPVSLAIDPD